MGNLFYGKSIAEEINYFVRNEIQTIYRTSQIKPTLAVIKLDREDSLKMAEVRLHTNLAKQLGIAVHEIVLDPSTQEEALIRIIQKCNITPSIHGILALLPLPDHIDQEAVLAAISKEKELEGLHDGKNPSSSFENKQSNVLVALLKVMERLQVNLFKSQCVFISDNSTLKLNAVIKNVLERARFLQIPLTTIAKESEHAEQVTRQADLLAVSLQTPGIIDKDYIKDGAIVIDFNPILIGEKYCEKKGAMVSIVKSSLNVDSLLTKAKYVLPATGGIGPISLAQLMHNFLHNYKMAVLREK